MRNNMMFHYYKSSHEAYAHARARVGMAKVAKKWGRVTLYATLIDSALYWRSVWKKDRARWKEWAKHLERGTGCA